MTVVTEQMVSAHATADVYRTPAEGLDQIDTYYFCCKTCGNCGRRWTGRKPAIEDAMKHVTNHPIPQEG